MGNADRTERLERETPQFHTGDKKLDYLLSNTFFLGEHGGMDNAMLWLDSLEDYLANRAPREGTPSLLTQRTAGVEAACGCRRCNPARLMMIVCPQCGDKRCPHALDHDQPCAMEPKEGLG